MADEKKNGETPDLGQRDLNNPRDRDALKRAADDFLKARKDEAVAEAAEDDAAAEDAINPLAELQVENNALKDQMLRLAADMENLRKRTAREMQDAKAYAVTNFARDMLSVSDNLRRALDAIPTDALAEDTGLKALAEGVEMTERAMINALERHGVTQLSPEGQKFDPNFHQAIFEVPNAEVPNNTVVQVMQTGYAIGDRVLRPAMVGVSRGGPKE
ncbi:MULTISPECIES: nucleotide exchange factor GrpE [Pseudochrobactrum]|uniref:Protein GrpE n=1 Tax=Pseudochrobactrum saccharolyticum TaxID=354352 RepID=A0A7W8AJF9_9HYPH|nr:MULTISPECIES: nucleotide exchange factor GrpE [Pseudochrobactrum]MBX8782366.1 nucleotide exchange factor GrpE [Ochrobactrum sp. GRS2]KAB0540608.1 nucleotide exchange factor GrpE [Pseudochrobactrum saccharolyticum]MBB5090173.1 molecular chaperone GrpE [Pseudochrobactrum saccharolyticum]MDP8252076.1 nucleotide exchange factor GrpE [Pseudochrobactrum saccharolyticum]UCA45836.1 nucleotide exchange factor GrpE [Pseudochrobactrum sp. XF203]